MVALTNSIKRGSAELAALAVLKGQPLHGYEIARHLEQQTGGLLPYGQKTRMD